MILSFLQRRNPPILPSLQKLEGHRVKSEDGKISSFADDLESLKGFGDANKESLAELLFQFFRHYGYEFIYSEFVVSIREGQLLSRKQKGWSTTNYADKEARNRLCVEEPFTVSRNLGNSADDYSWSGIHNEIRRAFELLANGCQLEKCCEEFEFPLEEKPIFVRPTPKPAPILRRSASQSGRPNHEQGSGRSHNKKNRNQSTHRSNNNNRRASSGASFLNQRGAHGFSSPSMGAQQLPDYFGAKGSIHDQLFQQYQFLQAQQDALRSQLAQHAQQQHGQGQGQPVPNIGASQRHPGYTNGMPSPRFSESAPQTAPLLPGYLYHFPARYPPPSSMSQARSRGEGTNTNPSSPSLVAAVPVMRRQGHRASSVTNGSPGAMRSQSQPGRSLPHPLTLHQQVHPGYDVSGAFPAQYQHLRTSQGIMPGMPLALSPIGVFPGLSSRDNAMPKEYVGYYVGHSPQLGPQSQYATSGQGSVSSMPLRDSPSQRPRRVTPDLAPPLGNGCHTSRSPSPLGNQRNDPTLAERRATQSRLMHSASDVDEPTPMHEVAPTPIDIGGPLIVNGSNPSFGNAPMHLTNGFHDKDLPSDQHKSPPENDRLRMRSLSIRTSDPGMNGRIEATNGTVRGASPPGASPKSTPKVSGSVLSPSPNTKPVLEQFTEPIPLSAPLLSPVAEMRTPSPTQIGAFDKLDSPIQSNGHVQSKLRMVDRQQDENLPSQVKHERKGSAPNPSHYGKPARSPVALTPLSAGANTQNGWQQATRKGHKKSKSNVGSKASIGKAIPVNEFERKGG
nr:poly(a) rna polymerase cid13 [Quercus suber]